MGIMEQIWDRIRDMFTDEELNNFIIHEEMKERERLRQEDNRQQIQIPLEPPPSVYDEPEQEESDEQRGVVIFDI